MELLPHLHWGSLRTERGGVTTQILCGLEGPVGVHVIHAGLADGAVAAVVAG